MSLVRGAGKDGGGHGSRVMKMGRLGARAGGGRKKKHHKVLKMKGRRRERRTVKGGWLASTFWGE